MTGEQQQPGEDGAVPRSEDERDTEGHRVPSVDRVGPKEGIGPGEKFLRGDGTPADLAERDTEGHLVLRRAGHGGE